MDQNQKAIAAALRQLELLNLQSAFDPLHPNSRATHKQEEVIADFGKIKQQWIRAGNQCQPGDTLVATPRGPVRLDSLRPGDTVYSEHGEPIQVLKCFDNGVQEVADLTCRGVRWATSTANHVFQVVTPYSHFEEKRADSFGRDDRVRRVTVRAPLGTVRNDKAYALGALLGDGCSRQPHKYLQISSGIAEVPSKVAACLGNTALKLHSSNHTWSVGRADIPYYAEWCKDRYAHEKIVDLDVVKTWDRQSLLEFVAGLIDTDGTVYANRDQVSLMLTMQAKSVVDAFAYACLALWQVPMNRQIDSRAKYKNGPVHVAYIRNVHSVRDILSELDPYLSSPQKKWREEYSSVGGKRSSSEAVGLKYGFNKREVHTYDIQVDSPTNLYLLANGLVSHNSGKSQTCARLITWAATNTHPTWKRPQMWGEEPLLILVAGRTGKQIEDSLLPKIRSYLEPGTYKEVRIGNIIQRLELSNGTRFVFQSLENPNTARERLMSYVAHITWCDELPPSIELVRELLVRTQAKNGMSLFSFTPTVVKVDIQQYVDQLEEPEGKVYRFNMLDNPIYSDEQRKGELLGRYSHLPQDQQKAIFEGEWLSGDNQVYYFNYNTMVRDIPANYSPDWRHVESVDPATQSALGLTLWAEEPISGEWYCILAEYVKGIYVPTDLVTYVQQRTAGRNIVLRTSDVAPWFTNQARAMGVSYRTVFKKANRKMELIKGLQEKLGQKVYLTPATPLLAEELQECRWSDKAEEKIVGSSTYHLLDSAQYFCDNIPASDSKKLPFTSWHAELLKQNQKRVNTENRINDQLLKKSQKMSVRRVGRWT